MNLKIQQPNQPTQNPTEMLKFSKEKLQPQPTQPTDPKQRTN